MTHIRNGTEKKLICKLPHCKSPSFQKSVCNLGWRLILKICSVEKFSHKTFANYSLTWKMPNIDIYSPFCIFLRFSKKIRSSQVSYVIPSFQYVIPSLKHYDSNLGCLMIWDAFFFTKLMRWTCIWVFMKVVIVFVLQNIILMILRPQTWFSIQYFLWN